MHAALDLVKEHQEVHAFLAEGMVEGDEHPLPVSDCVRRNVALSVTSVAVGAECDQVARLVAPAVLYPDDVVNFKRQDMATSWVSAHVACLTQHFVPRGGRYTLSLRRHRPEGLIKRLGPIENVTLNPGVGEGGRPSAYVSDFSSSDCEGSALRAIFLRASSKSRFVIGCNASSSAIGWRFFFSFSSIWFLILTSPF